ncbi:MAG TPA: FAD-dependent monooxygenase [Actinomycetota bacterium]|nr:FAD-dependent monooxygenase [Actinomycetota bacterium]
MRIEVVGGGPAGLYFALLAKKADPSREIVVHERNAPDSTFGWGVVFSEETLGAFRDADHATWSEITDTFVRWSAIDVHFRGATVRSVGHGFSGIARKRLLLILQERCRTLGVQLRFHDEVPGVDALADADLVVAADGVNSVVRRSDPEAFGESELVHRTRYVWFGTDRVFRAFTFIFRETEHGMFQVHAYPFDADRSTFVVECREDVWARAGLDGAGEEESIAFCQELFAPELDGRALLSNRSLWVNFVTLRCETWHRGNVVLLGDAAHTAHFTIGSGTKLAMEDSIALAGALERHRDLEAALTSYELERQPAVERLQRAALDSAAYFENVSRYARFEPVRFAMNLLTRSGRISYANLTQRDPELVRRADAAFAGREDGAVAPPPAFVPLTVRGLDLANRIAVSSASEDEAVEGTPSAAAEERIARLAAKGVALALSEPVAVSAEGRITPGSTGLYDEAHLEGWTRIRKTVRAAGAAFGLVLSHAGRRGATRPRSLGADLPLAEPWPLLAPSALPAFRGGIVPREMDDADLERVREAFVRAASLADEAGVHLLELDMAHGNLLGSFLSPLSNLRADSYGGSPDARMRYPLEVLEAVRDEWPRDRPLAVQIPATEWARGGFDVDDAVALAGAVSVRGAAFVHVASGGPVARSNPEYGPGYLVPFADRIRNEAGVPVIVEGRIWTLDQANTMLAAGRADVVVLETTDRRRS